MSEDDIFQTLRSELTADTDVSGVPESAWFWDEAFTRIAEAYSSGVVPPGAHLEMQDLRETPSQSVLQVSSSVRPMIAVPRVDEDRGSLIGNHTDRSLSVIPLTLQLQEHGSAYVIPAWVAVTRGGQRWARLGSGKNRQLVNLQDAVSGAGMDAVGTALDFASRVQQRHMGLELPEPDFSPLDMITSIAVSQAAHLASQAAQGPDAFASTAWRALKAQAIMRVASLRALLNVSQIFDDERFPIDALIRLDSMSDYIDHLGCGRPEHASRILSPGATATLHDALEHLSELTWSDIDPDDLKALTGMTSDEAKWWGPRGIALVCLNNTGGVGRVWDQLSAQVGPFLGTLVADAQRTGLSGPIPA